MSFRISVDTGGTFTDVAISDESGKMHIGKALTTYKRAFLGVKEAVRQVADSLGLSTEELFENATHFAYGTTRSTNAIVEKKTAKTAFLTTRGFPDILLLREGGRLGGAFTPREFGEPYVPRYLTFEIDERIDSDGDVHKELDENSIRSAINEARNHGVAAFAVSLLWSTVNADHERRVGELIRREMPNASITLSHELNPILREYRRASSTVIDASLKPLMQAFLTELSDDLHEAGFRGAMLLSTTFGGSWPVRRMIEKPIYSVGSGPSMAPVAALDVGRSALSTDRPDLLVCDTGGTTFDVGLISSGNIHYSNDTWLGEKWTGHITGTKSVDVRSIGAGGGSIISVDQAGLVRVGPKSAGADPGPACYGNGGTLPTVTDAALILGYFDPKGFVGGTLTLDAERARDAIRPVAEQMGTSVERAARGALIIATQNIVSAIREMTISQGIDPRELALVAGGGASGINVVQIARELGIETVILPKTAGALSAAGAITADLVSDFSSSRFTSTRNFDADGVRRAFEDLSAQAEEFEGEIAHLNPTRIIREYTVDARYLGQVWELETALVDNDITDPEKGLSALEERFHERHQRVFQVNDPHQEIELLVWKLRVTAELEHPTSASASHASENIRIESHRDVHFADGLQAETPVLDGMSTGPGNVVEGPAIVLEPTTTLVLDSGASLQVSKNGDYVINVGQNQVAAELNAAIEEA